MCMLRCATCALLVMGRGVARERGRESAPKQGTNGSTIVGQHCISLCDAAAPEGRSWPGAAGWVAGTDPPAKLAQQVLRLDRLPSRRSRHIDSESAQLDAAFLDPDWHPPSQMSAREPRRRCLLMWSGLSRLWLLAAVTWMRDACSLQHVDQLALEGSFSRDLSVAWHLMC